MAKPVKKSHFKTARKTLLKKKIHAPVSNKMSGVPRHEISIAKPNNAAAIHRDATRDSVTAYLQPFAAYQQRLQPGLPVVGDNQALYGFWTRNILQVTERPYASGTAGGCWVAVRPWLSDQIAEATSFLDGVGTPNTYGGYSDPFRTAAISNFEFMACAYQGVRVKNLTAVLNQAGECLVARTTYNDSFGLSFPAARQSGTAAVKSAADPGVMITLTYQGLSGMVPSAAGNIVDYGLMPPTALGYDPKSSTMLFRSQSSVSNPQTWEVEVVTCYLARPFANTSVFFAPTKHEVDMIKFDRLVDRAEAVRPEYSIARVAVKDDGDSPTIIADLETIWNGASAVGRVATAAWSGLSSLFGMQAEQRYLRALNFINDDDDLKTFSDVLGHSLNGTMDRLTVSCAPQPDHVSRLDYEALLKRLDDLEKQDWERIPESNTQLRFAPQSGVKR